VFSVADNEKTQKRCDVADGRSNTVSTSAAAVVVTQRPCPCCRCTDVHGSVVLRCSSRSSIDDVDDAYLASTE